tara:strand:+ start:380 stop:1309 length:930 start_codon:yes stop_codon:yes gene_type:complete
MQKESTVQIIKIDKEKIDTYAAEIGKANLDITGDGVDNLLKIQAAALLCENGEFDDLVSNSRKALDYSKIIPVRVFSINLKDYIFIKYKKSFIHIPKTGGRHLMYRYFVYQAGGNHLFASRNSPNYGPYCTDFNRCFTVVRNPFSWLYSYWSHVEGEEKTGHNGCRSFEENNTFEKFIFNVCSLEEDAAWFPFSSGITSQIFNENEEICASEIMFFERYIEGIRDLKLDEKDDFLMMAECPEKHRKFIDFKESFTDYRPFYTSAMIDAVSKKFKFDLSFLGYDFEGLTHEKASIQIPYQVHKSNLPLFR